MNVRNQSRTRINKSKTLPRVLGDQVGEGMATTVAAPALARLMTGFAYAFLDHVFGTTLGAAGDGWVDGR
jgi:hypothetical protein